MILLSIYVLYSNMTYIYPVSCLVEIKLFQIVSIVSKLFQIVSRAFHFYKMFILAFHIKCGKQTFHSYNWLEIY